jgi:hypothetical protein
MKSYHTHFRRERLKLADSIGIKGRRNKGFSGPAAASWPPSGPGFWRAYPNHIHSLAAFFPGQMITACSARAIYYQP